MRKIVVLLAAVIVFLALLIMLFLFGSAAVLVGADAGQDFYPAGYNLSDEVLQYRSIVENYADEFGVSDYVNYLLAIMQVESGGRGNDVMCSSESVGLPPGSLDPDTSIKQGVSYFAGLLRINETYNCDFKTVIQSYNYGSGFMNFIADNGGVYTFELTVEYAEQKSGGVKVEYKDPLAVSVNGGWKYKYGSMFYVPHVLNYMPYEAFDDERVQAVFDEALKYYGWKYVFGGSSPETSFDCSGLTRWCYASAGVSLPRTAQEQYEDTQHISLDLAEPGDLVFFEGTYDTSCYITHVGIYAGNMRMYHAGDPIGYADLTEAYWQEHLVCAGRIRE